MHILFRFTAITILVTCILLRSNSQELQNDDQRWWNLLNYDLHITPDYITKSLTGKNNICFEVLNDVTLMQIDLQEPMVITTVTWHEMHLPFVRKANNFLVRFPTSLKKGQIETITIHFKGIPKVAPTPPYTSGWIWSTDEKGRPWMSVACEGSGASIWFPCKNLLIDEPDSGVTMHITVPDSLVAVGNGRLKEKKQNRNGTTTWSWTVVNPINHYNIIPYIGKYVSWHDKYKGEKGMLDRGFWVLDYNVEKAKRQFQQVDTMLACFEHWLGPYPFYEDGYQLVESPHAGMEHQSAIAYGNKFMNGFRGRDVSSSGWGLKWDFIMVHESGHEWFGNSITEDGNGGSWIHEGFTKYLETIYTGWLYGPAAADDYSFGIQQKILNDHPIIGGGTNDYYNKASTVLHMIRKIYGDEAFLALMRGLNSQFYHQVVSSKQVEEFISQSIKKNLSKLFDQYFRTIQVPVLEYTFKNGSLMYRWSDCVSGFDMPVSVSIGGNAYILIWPGDKWKDIKVNDSEDLLKVDRNYYVKSRYIKQ